MIDINNIRELLPKWGFDDEHKGVPAFKLVDTVVTATPQPASLVLEVTRKAVRGIEFSKSKEFTYLELDNDKSPERLLSNTSAELYTEVSKLVDADNEEYIRDTENFNGVQLIKNILIDLKFIEEPESDGFILKMTKFMRAGLKEVKMIAEICDGDPFHVNLLAMNTRTLAIEKIKYDLGALRGNLAVGNNPITNIFLTLASKVIN